MDYADLNQHADWLDSQAETIWEGILELPEMVQNKCLDPLRAAADNLRNRARDMRTEALVGVARRAEGSDMGRCRIQRVIAELRRIAESLDEGDDSPPLPALADDIRDAAQELQTELLIATARAAA